MHLKGFRPLDRGEVSILAALVLVTILAGTGLFFQSFAPNNPRSMTAGSATPAAAPAAPAAPLVDPAVREKCDAAIAQAKTAATEKVGSKPSATVSDDCVAAVKTSEPVYKGIGYKCVGKSGNVFVRSDGTLDIKTAPDPNVKPGKCRIAACQQATLDAGKLIGVGTKLKCAPSDSLAGINKGNITDLIANSPSAFSAVRTVGGVTGLGSDYFYPVNAVGIPTTLDAATNSTINAAFGRDPNNTTGYIPMVAGSDGLVTLAPPSNDQILKFAAANPDPAAATASLQTTSAALQLNPNLADASVLKPPCTTDCGGGGGGGGGGGSGAGAGAGTGAGAGQGSGSTFGSGSGMNSLLAGLAKGLAGALNTPPQTPAAPAQPCSTDPNAYAQQQQQYQQQLQQYNYQLQQQQYQQQMQQYYAMQSGNNSMMPPPQQPLPAQPTPCSPTTQNQCATQPAQPAANSCTTGSWQPQYSGNCIVNWQCSNSSSNLGPQLDCQPKTADVGMQLAITYSCALGNATGSGFTATSTSGIATTTVVAPPAGTNTATYGLTCTSGNQTAGAQCSVQVSAPGIVLVANPATIASGQTSQLGWVTSGMQACVISSPADAAFTAANVSNTSVSGTAITLAATSTESYLLHCQTLAGGTKDATTTVTVQ